MADETNKKELPEDTKPVEEVQCGYIVALKKDGSLVFEFLGETQGLVEILGLHQFASLKINEPLRRSELEPIHKVINGILQILMKKDEEVSRIVKP
jgi:hypothetical protein